MGFFTLNPRDDAAKWANLIDMLPAYLRDVHFSPQFMAAQEMLGHQSRLAVYTYQDYVVVQPIIIRDVEIGGRWTGYRDIASAVGGFGGPVSNHNHTLNGWFSESFTAWCRDNKIVSEFCALSPMMLEHQKSLLLPNQGTSALTLRKQVVVMELSGPDAGADQYHKRRAQGVSAAWRNGVRIMNYPYPSSDGDSWNMRHFVDLYRETMKRQQAAERWWLPEEHLLELCKFGIAFCAYVQNELESVALLIGRKAGDNSTAYYHLAANALRHPNVGANDLLVHEMAAWAKQVGFRWLHLGGGVTSAEDDPVFFYKAGFSDLRRPAMSYFRVFDPSAYKQLCAAKAEDEIDKTGVEFTTTSFEPMYRREMV